MISDEAVEAAASVLAFRGYPKAPQPYLNKLWSQMSDDDEEIEVDGDLRLKRGRDSFREEARAALEAALPHLLASQGCGTGHSADAGSLPALADASGVIRRLIFRLEDLLEIARQWEPDYCGDRFARQLFFAREARDAARVYLSRGTYRQPGPIETGWDQERLAALSPDGGEAVHSQAEREGSRDEPKNDLAHPQKGGEGC